MGKAKLQCPHCLEKYKQQKKYDRHQRDVHYATSAIYLYTPEGRKESIITRNEKGKFICTECKKQYVNRRQLQKHHKANHNPNAKKKKQQDNSTQKGTSIQDTQPKNALQAFVDKMKANQEAALLKKQAGSMQIHISK